MQVMVIGAGVVGLAIAREAALRGHDVIVAEAASSIVTRDTDIGKLEAIYRQALVNGVENVTMLDAAEAKRMEPALFCVAAFHSAETGVIDSHRFMLALEGDIEDRGGVVAFNN